MTVAKLRTNSPPRFYLAARIPAFVSTQACCSPLIFQSPRPHCDYQLRRVAMRQGVFAASLPAYDATFAKAKFLWTLRLSLFIAMLAKYHLDPAGTYSC